MPEPDPAITFFGKPLEFDIAHPIRGAGSMDRRTRCDTWELPIGVCQRFARIGEDLFAYWLVLTRTNYSGQGVEWNAHLSWCPAARAQAGPSEYSLEVAAPTAQLATEKLEVQLRTTHALVEAMTE